MDDAKIGVKSTALLFGDRIRAILPLFSAGFIIALSVGGFLNNQGIWYYLISVGLATLHLMWQLITFNENDADDCGNKFDVRIYAISSKFYAHFIFTVKWYPRMHCFHRTVCRLSESDYLNT